MCNHELLVAYLYDDLPAADRAAFEFHARQCDACREELRQLRGTREHLASWAPPEPAFDIQVVRRAEPPPRRASWVPAWGLAAAASLLLLAGAAAIANLDVRVGSDGVVVRTGWGGAVQPEPPGALPAETPVAVSPAAPEVSGELLALDARLRELETAMTAAAAPVAAPAGGVDRAAIDAAEARLRRLITESERRQRTEVAVQITQMWRDLNAVRASDFVRVQESLDRVQGQTNYQLRQHRDQVQSQLYRVTLQK
jgi:hypothetical protein